MKLLFNLIRFFLRLKPSLRDTTRTARLKRAERRLEQQIRIAHADSLAHIGRMSLQQGEVIPALSLQLADVRTQLRGGMPRSQRQARPAMYQAQHQTSKRAA